ncbi:MAG: SWIM zinc finger family protein [Actinobacteria bacterium]|nr:SWIM zinc finger family protein [Actinomycetota bacterium]
MSSVLLPGQFRGDPHPVGRLASTLVSVAVAGMADPPRFRRGKLYVAEGAVTRIEVSPGMLLATVVGSRDQPYQVMASVGMLERPQGPIESMRGQLTRLTPEAHELMVSCTCPDDAYPCKHTVAALLAFAAELVARPELLLEWRCGSGDHSTPGDRAAVGSRARRGAARHLRLAHSSGVRTAPEPPPPDQWATDEWRQFLGSLPLPSPPALELAAMHVRRSMLGTIDLGAWVQSALDELTSL